jgi:small subunit ribosomal protein S16
MALKIRLKRMGMKKAPFYRFVVSEATAPRDGRFVEEIGYYDPTKNPPVVHINEESAMKWLSTGATPTDTVRSIFSHAGLMKRFDESKSKPKQ